jgi:micrococcal nuclease
MSKYKYSATVVKIVDGDTIDISIDLGFKISIAERVRLYGIDTPETYGVKKGSAEYNAGKAATAFVEQWLRDCDAHPVGNAGEYPRQPMQITIQSYDGKELHTGKYGRWIADVYRPGDLTSLSAALAAAGHAKYVSY